MGIDEEESDVVEAEVDTEDEEGVWVEDGVVEKEEEGELILEEDGEEGEGDD